MFTSALVLTIIADDADVLVKQIAQDTRCQVGEICAGFLPVVTNTASLQEARQLFDELEKAPSVLGVQLVSWTDEEQLSRCNQERGASA